LARACAMQRCHVNQVVPLQLCCCCRYESMACEAAGSRACLPAADSKARGGVWAWVLAGASRSPDPRRWTGREGRRGVVKASGVAKPVMTPTCAAAHAVGGRPAGTRSRPCYRIRACARAWPAVTVLYMSTGTGHWVEPWRRCPNSKPSN
jgi:hypothetical protein